MARATACRSGKSTDSQAHVGAPEPEPQSRVLGLPIRQTGGKNPALPAPCRPVVHLLNSPVPHCHVACLLVPATSARRGWEAALSLHTAQPHSLHQKARPGHTFAHSMCTIY